MDHKPIVVGIEDKQPCAVRFAAEAAAMRGVGLRVVHCLDDPRDVAHWLDTAAYSLDASPTEVQEVLDAAREVIETMESPPDTRYVLGAGSPSEILAEEAAQASLIVVGTDSIGRMERLFDGAVTDHLVKHAPVPVAIVPEVSWPVARTGVVLALDARASATGPIKFAFEEADRCDAELHVTHLAPAGLTASESSLLRAEIARLLAGWPQRYPEVRLTRQLTCGAADEGCLRESAEAGVLVLGRDCGRRHPVLTQLARHTHGPCVVVPDAWGDS
jgi:nucleotide-binding universal stress UspA family protein